MAGDPQPRSRRFSIVMTPARPDTLDDTPTGTFRPHDAPEDITEALRPSPSSDWDLGSP